MNYAKKTNVLGGVPALFLIFSGGCGPAEVTPPLPPPSHTADHFGPDADSNGWQNNGNHPPEVGIPGCEPKDQLGVIGAGFTRIFKNATTVEEGRATACYTGTGDSGQWLMTFEVREPVIATIDVTSPIGAHPFYQLNRGECLSESPIVCKQEPRHVFIAEPGAVYYLWVEKPNTVNEQRFDVAIELEEFVCFPGELACTDGEVEVCHQGRRWQELGPCIDSCQDETTCRGDACENAILVELSPNGPNRAKHFLGDRYAFTNEWDAQGLPACDLRKDELLEGQEDIGGPTPHGEVFFRVPNLISGQTLSMEAINQTGNYGFYILSDCAATSCLDAGTRDIHLDRKLEWQVTTSGDYVVVIESLGDQARDFEFVFELRN
jgi:hypothetical protein